MAEAEQNKFNPIDWVFSGGLLIFWLAFWFCVWFAVKG